MSFLSCQRELDFGPTPGQDVSTSLTGEIVFTVADARAELLTKSSLAEDRSTISYGMIRPSDGEGHHIANITMRSEPLDLPAWVNDTQTKADVTGLSSFYVTCVTGSAGSESQSWGNVGFSGSSTFSGGKYWPSSNLGYKFYASNASMSFASDGTTVAASNSTDVVVAYKTDATYYASSNSLSFSHIFGKVGSVTVSPAEGFDSSDITDISITIIPKTGGTYNIRTGSWSSISTGSATAIANSTPGTKSNDLYLVPDTYTISASWNARGMEFEGSGEFTVSAGECKNFTITLGGQVFVFSVSVTKKVKFAPGNLQAVIGTGLSNNIATASEWHFAEHQYDYIGNAAGNTSFAVGSTVDLFGWVGENASYESYGLCTSAKPKFTYYNIPYYGDRSDAIMTDWGSIPGIETWIGSGWRTLTNDEWKYLITQRANYLSLLGQCQITTANGTVKGLLILPDNWTQPSNCAITRLNGFYTRVTYDATVASGASNAWCDMEAAGAVFLPAGGRREEISVNNENYSAGYWSSTANSDYKSLVFSFSNNYLGYYSSTSNYVDRWYGYHVRLVRDLSKKPSEPATFNGLMIAPAPLYYNGSTFAIVDDDWNHSSYSSIYGKNSGSYYFTFVDVGQFFDSRGSSFSTSSGDINNAGSKVAYGGYNDWRMPTQAEWASITTGTSRTGSTVNGIANVRFAIIQLTVVTHAGSSSPVGVLLFPDGKTIVGKTLQNLNSTLKNHDVTAAELTTYLEQGCVFLPASGTRAGSSWSFGGMAGFYWSASSASSGDAKALDFSDDSLDPDSPYMKISRSFTVRLVRTAN